MNYINKVIVVFANLDAISILNQAEDIEVMSTRKMRISQQNPAMVEIEVDIERNYYEILMTALNEVTLAFELIRD